MLLPTVCPVCGRPGSAPCQPCRAALPPAPALPPPPGLAACAAVMAYQGAGRELVARLKYRNARSSLRWLADEMAALVSAGGADADAGVDIVSWAPTSATRRRHRGFDQGRLLALALARRLRLPCVRTLRRRGGPSQTGRSRAARLAGPAFVVARTPVPPRVLLVDDVVTTGATLAAAAAQLRRAGAKEVRAVVAARRP